MVMTTEVLKKHPLNTSIQPINTNSFFFLFKHQLKVVLVAILGQAARSGGASKHEGVTEVNHTQAGQEGADFTHISSSPSSPSHHPFQFDLQLQDQPKEATPPRWKSRQGQENKGVVGITITWAQSWSQTPLTTQNELNSLEKEGQATIILHKVTAVTTSPSSPTGFASCLRKANKYVSHISHKANLQN